MQTTGSGLDKKPLRYGIVGTGMMGREHIADLLDVPGASITAIADPEPESIAAAQLLLDHQPQRPATFKNHRDLLAGGNCDVVVVASPNHTHDEVLADVLADDLHVLIEKPLCTTTAGCRVVVDQLERRSTDRLVWVAMEYRYMAAITELIRLVHAGTVGTPHMVSVREHRFPFLPKVGDWNRFSHLTGGTLVEKTCHFFDLMNLILHERPERVMASGAQGLNHLDEVYDGRRADMLDNAFVIVDYPGGARALLDLCMFAEATDEQEEISVIGDSGKVEAAVPSHTIKLGRRGQHDIGSIERYTAPQDHMGRVGLHHGSSFIQHLRLKAAIDRGTGAEVTVTDGYWAVATGVAAHRSIELGRPVELAEVMSTATETTPPAHSTRQENIG